MVALMANELPIVDMVGIGLNATDTIIRLPHFPAFNSKIKVLSVERRAGGEAASAAVACRRWGLSARYAGSIGDDEAGQFQRRQLEKEGVEAHWLVARGARSQFAFILVDEPSGERTVLWGREPALAMRPEQLDRRWVERARLLLVDGHDAPAAAQSARWARAAGIPVVADVDNLYPGVEGLLESADFLLASEKFPERLLGEPDPQRALPMLARNFGCRLTAVTLGERGALAWDGARFHYAPAFLVDAADTTGAGDVFHAGYIYGLLAGWQTGRCLEFASAAAGLNCTRTGARGGIFPVEEILHFVETAHRREVAYDVGPRGRAAARKP